MEKKMNLLLMSARGDEFPCMEVTSLQNAIKSVRLFLKDGDFIAGSREMTQEEIEWEEEIEND
jgi:hypothetical protein